MHLEGKHLYKELLLAAQYSLLYVCSFYTKLLKQQINSTRIMSPPRRKLLSLQSHPGQGNVFDYDKANK